MRISVLRKATYLRLFMVYTIVLFVIIAAILYVFQLVPDELGSSSNTVVAPQGYFEKDTVEDIYVADVVPTRVIIATVGIDTSVNNPGSQNVEILDQALLSGAVYYPGSGSLTQGNAFIFGHSTGLSVVRNQAFKAFNNLKNVQTGDEIRVFGEDGNTYVYSAISIELVTEDTELVEFDTTDRMITLSTCNTFGQKSDRHVVKAVFTRVE